MLMRFPLRDGLEFEAATGTTWATSSAVAEAVGAGGGMAMWSGAFLPRGLTVEFVVVLDKGREGVRVDGREGPATFPSLSCSRLEWRAWTRRDPVWTISGMGSTTGNASRERERRFLERERERERLRKLAICRSLPRTAMQKKRGHV